MKPKKRTQTSNFALKNHKHFNTIEKENIRIFMRLQNIYK